jgi:uncharacterized protein with gpF-like domain
LVVEHLREFNAQRIQGLVNDETIEQLRDQLAQGIRAGEGALLLAKRVESVFDAAKGYRAVRIARTEVLRSSNFAIYEAYRQSGVVDKKQWVSTPDGRTRNKPGADHLSSAEAGGLNGQIQPLNQPFRARNGHTAMQPGDFGIAKEDINCRCTLTAVIDNPKSMDQRNTIWKGYIDKTDSWETDLRDALINGFETQYEAALAALAKVSQ